MMLNAIKCTYVNIFPTFNVNANVNVKTDPCYEEDKCEMMDKHAYYCIKCVSWNELCNDDGTFRHSEDCPCCECEKPFQNRDFPPLPKKCNCEPPPNWIRWAAIYEIKEGYHCSVCHIGGKDNKPWDCEAYWNHSSDILYNINKIHPICCPCKKCTESKIKPVFYHDETCECRICVTAEDGSFIHKKYCTCCTCAPKEYDCKCKPPPGWYRWHNGTDVYYDEDEEYYYYCESCHTNNDNNDHVFCHAVSLQDKRAREDDERWEEQKHIMRYNR